MQIKTIMRYHLTSVRMITIKKKKMTSVNEDMEKFGNLCTLWGDGKGAAVGKIVCRVFITQEINNHVMQDIYPK